MKKKRLPALMLFIVLLLLPALSTAAQVGQALIPFKGNLLNGQAFDLQPYVGKKPVMLIFWASWCPSCRTEVPKINQLAEKFAGRMEFIAINVGFNDSVERAQDFVRKTGMTYPVYFDATSVVTERYRLQGVPTILIADKHGLIRFRNYATPEITDANFALLIAD